VSEVNPSRFVTFRVGKTVNPSRFVTFRVGKTENPSRFVTFRVRKTVNPSRLAVNRVGCTIRHSDFSMVLVNSTQNRSGAKAKRQVKELTTKETTVLHTFLTTWLNRSVKKLCAKKLYFPTWVKEQVAALI
jgi:hypothetical protein